MRCTLTVFAFWRCFCLCQQILSAMLNTNWEKLCNGTKISVILQLTASEGIEEFERGLCELNWTTVMEEIIDYNPDIKIYSDEVRAAAWQIQQNDLYIQRRLRSAWASAQSDESAVRMKKPWALRGKVLIRLGSCPDWSESSLGAQVILLVLSCCGSKSTN